MKLVTSEFLFAKHNTQLCSPASITQSSCWMWPRWTQHARVTNAAGSLSLCYKARRSLVGRNTNQGQHSMIYLKDRCLMVLEKWAVPTLEVISQFEGQTEFTVVPRKKQLYRATSSSNTTDPFGSHHNDSFKENSEVPRCRRKARHLLWRGELFHGKLASETPAQSAHCTEHTHKTLVPCVSMNKAQQENS